jgi:quinol monooxygenase YgiN
MPDLNVVAVLVAKAGSEAVLESALTSLVEPTRSEPGCVSYDLYHSAVDPATFITVELWRSQADLDAHMQTPHIAAALSAAEDAFAATPAIHPMTAISSPGGAL